MIRIARAFLILSILLPSLRAVSQNSAFKSNNPAVDAITSQLKELIRLPADEWRFHLGDVPHGEDVNLGDSGWTLVKAKSEAPQEAVWYRRWITVPPTLHGYDLTGTKLWFKFSAYG